VDYHLQRKLGKLPLGISPKQSAFSKAELAEGAGLTEAILEEMLDVGLHPLSHHRDWKSPRPFDFEDLKILIQWMTTSRASEIELGGLKEIMTRHEPEKYRHLDGLYPREFVWDALFDGALDFGGGRGERMFLVAPKPEPARQRSSRATHPLVWIRRSPFAAASSSAFQLTPLIISGGR
jgi:hypothetical protein